MGRSLIGSNHRWAAVFGSIYDLSLFTQGLFGRQASHALPGEASKDTFSGWFDILVHPEKIVWIVPLFNLHQALPNVLRVCVFYTIFTFIA
jgi:hypothetical protein